MRVTLDWLGVSTFRLVVGDLTIFLDAYIDRVPAAPPVGMTVADVTRADYVLVGHSHFDHLWGAERIAQRTGATVIGSHETVRLLHDEDEIPEQQLMAVAGDRLPRGEGGSLAYLIETPAGSILWKDSSGHWSGILRDLRPDLALLAAVGRGNADGEPVQGTLAGFVASEVELLRPKSVVLCHHDDWMPPLTTPIDMAPIRRELASRTPGARLVEMGYLEGRRVLD